jgi:ABC-2 type transport system ATP-binding protein
MKRLSLFGMIEDMKDAIIVENLVKKYKKADKNAVDDISFTVGEGEFFTLLGPNGAGKTTTIAILTTTLAKSSGNVKIAGYDLDKNPSEVRGKIGVIFQAPSLDENLTAEENVRFHSILYGLYPFSPLYSLMPRSYKNRVGELAEVLGIQNDLHKAIKTFSGGMKRKLEIIRSLMHHPQVLFLDEPTSGLDPLSRKNLWDYLAEIRKKEHTTIFLTTHYLEESEDADHVCVINHGKIVMYGTPRDIKKKMIHEYILMDSKEKEDLRRELSKLGLKFEEKEHFQVALEDKRPQQIIQSIKTELSYLTIHSPTLEEAYFKIIEPPKKDE